MLLTFQLHAREWISGMSGVFVIESIVNKLMENPDWLGSDEIVIIPMVNPDGFVFSEKSDRLWRKNRRINDRFGAFARNCNGVDINRNFPTAWGFEGKPSECSEIYNGKSAASEPETQAVIKMVDE